MAQLLLAAVAITTNTDQDSAAAQVLFKVASDPSSLRTSVAVNLAEATLQVAKRYRTHGEKDGLSSKHATTMANSEYKMVLGYVFLTKIL